MSIFSSFTEQGHFQEAFGYHCVDAGDVPGYVGSDVQAYVLRRLRRRHLWPIHIHGHAYTEDDVFDMIEFLFDHVTKPVHGRFHDFAGCGWHYETFDRHQGRAEFREEINAVLRDYEKPHELSESGEVLVLADEGLQNLVDAPLPHVADATTVEERVKAAILLFRRHGASLDDRRRAVRDLADVLEYLRPQLRDAMTSKDESDLFNIANNFGIRHHNDQQKTDYDKAVWLSWMFYFYLATIHAALRRLGKGSI